MAEYNMQYNNLKKRLIKAKLIVESDMSLSESERANFKREINAKLIELDDRYFDNKPLSSIEEALFQLKC